MSFLKTDLKQSQVCLIWVNFVWFWPRSEIRVGSWPAVDRWVYTDLPSGTIGRPDLGRNRVRLAPNRTNPGLYQCQIRSSTFWHVEPNGIESDLTNFPFGSKSVDCVALCAVTWLQVLWPITALVFVNTPYLLKWFERVMLIYLLKIICLLEYD